MHGNKQVSPLLHHIIGIDDLVMVHDTVGCKCKNTLTTARYRYLSPLSSKQMGSHSEVKVNTVDLQMVVRNK